MKHIQSISHACLILLLVFNSPVILKETLVAQNVNVDSLMQILDSDKQSPDNKVKVLSELYHATVRSDTSIAFSHAREMAGLEKQLTDSLSKSLIYMTLGDYYGKKERVAESLQQYEKALLSLSTGDTKEFETERAGVLVVIGSFYHQFDDYETAYTHYLEAEKLYLKHEGYNELINIYGKMASIFLRNSDILRNKQIIEKCDAIIHRVTDPNVLASYYTNRGNVYGYEEDYVNCDSCFEKALAILKKTNDQYRMGMLYYNMGFFARVRGYMEKSEHYYKQSLTAFENDGSKFDICDGITAIGRVHYYKKEYDEAESYLQKALLMAEQMESKLLMRNAYIALSWVEHDRGNYKDAFTYSEKGAEYEVDLVSEDTQKQLAFMEVRHETEKKEQHIITLEKEKRLILYLSIAAGILLLLTVSLFVARQRVNHHKIERLKKEKQLVATQSVLDGETAERTRLARDLHDGLGGMLSVVRFNLYDLKKGATIEGNDVERFNNALNTLDESIRELRRVAHNMMPDSLARYGLKPSLYDFCSSIPIVRFNYFGSGDRLDPKLEVMIYRTVNELVNNALKHAGAAEIIVQIVQEADRIALTVQDDGCGFDTTVPSDGSGLHNIRDRVSSYDGHLEIWSKPGEGTEISVEFQLSDNT